MANPVHFKRDNFVWKGWPATESEQEVKDLPAHRDEAAGVTISCWQLGWRERLKVLFTGKV